MSLGFQGSIRFSACLAMTSAVRLLPAMISHRARASASSWSSGTIFSI